MNKWYQTTADNADVSASTSICFARNLVGIPFPSRMSMADRRSVLQKIQAVLSQDRNFRYGRFTQVDLESISKAQAIALAESELISAEMVTDTQGRGVFVSEDESLSIAVNGEDHLLIQSKSAGMQLEKVFGAADELDTFLDRLLPFAFDAQLGYLTQNPFYLGTGMIASLQLHLPALTELGSTGRIAHNLSRLGLTMRGTFGTEPNPKGAWFRLSNQVTMGLSEREALSNLSSMAGQIISHEREMRETLTGRLSVQDTIFRDFGILKNARLISFEEFLKRASAVRLGITAGLIKGIAVSKLDTMIYKAQPATLIFDSGEALTEEECCKLRARMVREGLN
ncbi:MAG: ATP--guanido phosphotransferase [Oscillospiraceae bacterium]|jgi:protein arginine kinase|nr:ATP--guanido phosphotransferase [Oscillospiraceae bacterium]